MLWLARVINLELNSCMRFRVLGPQTSTYFPDSFFSFPCLLTLRKVEKFSVLQTRQCYVTIKVIILNRLNENFVFVLQYVRARGGHKKHRRIRKYGKYLAKILC